MDTIKGVVIGATGSGTGKTTVSLGIMAWLKAKGIKVAPFKVGPDFIDPGLHTKICGSVSHNLDSWMLSRQYNQHLFHANARGKDVAVVEGVMGLFDGYDALSDTGSTAQMAKWLGLPVLLIVSAKGKARSAAAVVKGFESFDPDLRFAGVIFAQAGSERHYHYLRDAVAQNCSTPCLGFLPKNDKIVMPERHLGLVTADEMPISKEALSTLVAMVNDHLDMDQLINGLVPMTVPENGAQRADISTPPKARIAVARDKAFCFYYPDNLENLEIAGAEIVMFSPLQDDALPENVDGIYLGGGYPELNAGPLSEKKGILTQIRQASRDGMPIYGECGGFMYLCRNIAAADGAAAGKMCSIFDLDIQMSKRLRSLGYRQITLASDTLIGKKGEVIRGHEFHYSSISGGAKENYASVYKVASRAGQDISLQGFQKDNTLGSYLHVHFGSNPNAARQFVDCCARYQTIRQGKAAAAAAKAALMSLLSGCPPEQVEIRFLTGEKIMIPVHRLETMSTTSASAVVIKDAGDDPDITHKAEIGAKVSLAPADAPEICITGGKGVGTVTKPGLEVALGKPAINSGPRQMIKESVHSAFEAFNLSFKHQVTVEVFVPKGETLAKKTLNSRLGILGGISILGTTGIVRPLSHDSYIATINSAISVARANGADTLVFTTGRRSERYAQGIFTDFKPEVFIQTGDFFKAGLDGVKGHPGIRQVIYTVFFGKAVKMALGYEHTHAAKSKLTLKRLAQWTGEITQDNNLAQQILGCNTARHAFEYIYPDYFAVLNRVGQEARGHAETFAGDGVDIRVIILDFEGKIAFDSTRNENNMDIPS